jgi:membrane protein YfhO
LALALYLAVATAIAWRRVSVAAAIALIAMPLLFTGKALFTNRLLAPADISFMAEPLHDYARDFGVETPHNGAISDLHCQILPWQRAVRDSFARGEWPLWNPHVLCGDVLAAAAQPAVYDPIQLIGLVLPLEDAFNFGVTMTFFLAAFFTFAFARALGLGEIAALVAAAGFAFCGMLAFFAGWPLGRSWAYLPLVLFAVRKLATETNAKSALLLAIAFVLVIFAGHPESVLHVVAVGAVYGAFETRRMKAIGLACAAGAIALMLSAIYLMPFAEAVPQTLEHFIRDELYAKTPYARLAPEQTRNERMARTFIRDNRGQDPLSARVGPVILALSVLGLFLARRNRHAWFFAALAVVCLLATFGSWPVAHVLHALPLFDIAINERLAFAAAFAMSMLAAFAIEHIRRREIAIVILGVVLLQRASEEGDIYPALPRKAFFPRVPIIERIPKDARMTGLGNALIPNNPTMYGFEDVRGYEAMTLRRFADTYPLWSKFQVAWFNRVDDLSKPFLSFLNVQYALGRGDAPDGWRVIAEDRGTRLYENSRVLPRAFVPPVIRYEKESKAVLEAMLQSTDFATRAWIEAQSYEPHDAANGPGVLTIARNGSEYAIDARMQQGGWVVISESAWKGWRAYVDDRRVAVHYANHAFLGVHVPEGNHRLRLVYRPQSFIAGRTISAATLLFIVVAGLWYRKRACRPSSSISPSASR